LLLGRFTATRGFGTLFLGGGVGLGKGLGRLDLGAA
jgi:hypothetical protein